MFENLFKIMLGGNGDPAVMYDWTPENSKFTLNGEEVDFADEEKVHELIDAVDNFYNNPLLRLFVSDEQLKTITEEMKEKIADAHHEAIGKTPHDDISEMLNDDAHYIANAYLEDTVDDWENVDDEAKKRSINALADFFTWMEKKAKEE